jgi:hypothetical protein
VAMNLPGELVWVLDMLGYEWPPIDEDEVRRAAQITRQFGEDLEGTIEVVDSKVHGDVVSAMKTGSATAYATAWDSQRQGNLRQLVELLDPAATGMEVFADAVVALKVKVIAELVITAAQIAAAAATALLTGGLSLAANAAIIAARKQALDILTEIAVDQVAGQVLSMLVEPLATVLVDLASAIAEAPVVEGSIGDVSEFDADLDALEQVAGDIEKSGQEQDSLAESFLAQISGCQIVTG